jgi:hypothetical protein
MVQVEVRGRHRHMSHPGLDSHRIDFTSEPQTRGSVAKVVNSAAASDPGPVQRPLERRRVQLVPRGRHKQQLVGRPAGRKNPKQRQHPISNRDPARLAG